MKRFLIIFTVMVTFIAFSMPALADSSASATAAASANSYQSQGQGQEQGQQQNQGQMLGLDDVGNIKDSFNSKPARGFAIPGEVNYGPLINYYGKPLPSSGFQRIEELIMYGSWFTEGALESMLKGAEKVECEFKLANEGIIVPKVKADKNGVSWIKVIIQKEKVKDAVLVGYSTARSEHPKTTMTEVMAKAALKALKNGCNVIHFTVQGAVRDTQSFGWGIGFNTTAASINNSQQHSSISSGGFGISGGTAGMRDKPWLQGFGLVVKDLKSPVSAVKAPNQTGNHRPAKKVEKKAEVTKVEQVAFIPSTGNIVGQ